MSEDLKCSRCGQKITKTHSENDDKIRVLFQLSQVIEVRSSTHLEETQAQCNLCEDCQKSLFDWFCNGEKEKTL